MNLFPRYSLHDDDDRLIDDPAAREAYDRLWAPELNSHVAEPFRSILNEWAAGAGKARSVPYPEFCRHPDKCEGLAYCPRDPICCD